MSMIDHDDIDRLNQRARADLDARRYRRNSDGSVWRVQAQARSPDGPYVLTCCDGKVFGLLTVHPAELARDFTRCDASAPLVAVVPIPRIPTPAELLPKPVDYSARIADAVTSVVRQLTESKGERAEIREDIPVLNGAADALRAAGWSCLVEPCRDGKTGALHVAHPSLVSPERPR